MKHTALNKPEHYATEAEAHARATELAPALFPQSACYVLRPDKSGQWHVCLETHAETRYADATRTVYISNDGDVVLAELLTEEVAVATSRRRGVKCKGCLRSVGGRDELYSIPGRAGKFCMDCATKALEE
jgi:hypothetical protein